MGRACGKARQNDEKKDDVRDGESPVDFVRRCIVEQHKFEVKHGFEGGSSHRGRNRGEKHCPPQQFRNNVALTRRLS